MPHDSMQIGSACCVTVVGHTKNGIQKMADSRNNVWNGDVMKVCNWVYCYSSEPRFLKVSTQIYAKHNRIVLLAKPDTERKDKIQNVLKWRCKNSSPQLVRNRVLMRWTAKPFYIFFFTCNVLEPSTFLFFTEIWSWDFLLQKQEIPTQKPNPHYYCKLPSENLLSVIYTKKCDIRTLVRQGTF